MRALQQGSAVGVAGALGLGRELFAQGVRAERATTVPLIVSTSLHALAIASILLIASLGFAVADERTEPLKEPEPMRMVFLALPGPGGGGGGGGLKMKTPPPKASARASKRSAVRCRRRSFRRRSEPIPKPPDPPKPLEAKPVIAPMPTKPADVQNRKA